MVLCLPMPVAVFLGISKLTLSNIILGLNVKNIPDIHVCIE
jgi:hypothetical protein